MIRTTTILVILTLACASLQKCGPGCSECKVGLFKQTTCLSCYRRSLSGGKCQKEISDKSDNCLIYGQKSCIHCKEGYSSLQGGMECKEQTIPFCAVEKFVRGERQCHICHSGMQPRNGVCVKFSENPTCDRGYGEIKKVGLRRFYELRCTRCYPGYAVNQYQRCKKVEEGVPENCVVLAFEYKYTKEIITCQVCDVLNGYYSDGSGACKKDPNFQEIF